MCDEVSAKHCKYRAAQRHRGGEPEAAAVKRDRDQKAVDFAKGRG